MISIVITAHNNSDFTRNCIESVRASNYKDVEIVLVDNASTDDTEILFGSQADIKYIKRETNDGSIIGRNVGINAASGSKVFVLDNDMVISPDTIEKYLDLKNDIVGFEMGVCNDSGIGRKTKCSKNDPREYLGIGGLMFDRCVINQIGLLDEGFSPAYCDDPDFHWRAVDAGFTWAMCHDSGITHIEHGTLSGVKAISSDVDYARSHARLVAKWPTRFPEFAPLVSYVIPTYNRCGFLIQAVESILKQNYPNIEIIVVDDGSMDGTGDIVCEKYPQIKYLKNDKNRRIPYTLNRGFHAARGKYVCWLSDDDGVFPEKTARQVSYMETHPEIDLSFHKYEIRHENGTVNFNRYIPFESNAAEFKFCLEQVICNTNGSTSMFRRDALKKHGYFIEVLWTVQDWEMWLRYLSAGVVGYIDENLGWRSEHNGVGQGLCQKDPKMMKLFDAEIDFVRRYYRMKTDAGRPTICAMMVVKNEIDMIEQCLDDLVLWVDKIVVLDDGSTDGTVDVIRQYPKVVDLQPKPDRGNTRQEAQDRTKLLAMAQDAGCDWILFIDADEVFEDSMKAQVYDLITSEAVNLWHFHEINFWRSRENVRVDELYDKGWFGRLFRNLPGLVMMTHDEHCGGIPCNIPDATMWGESPAGKRSDVGVKHYGFAEYKRTVDRAYRRWVRDPYRIEPTGEARGGWLFYNRMVNETGLKTVDYRESLV